MNSYITFFLPDPASADYCAQYFVYPDKRYNGTYFAYNNNHTKKSHFIYGPAIAHKNIVHYAYHGKYEVRQNPSIVCEYILPKGESKTSDEFRCLRNLPTAFKMTTDITIYTWLETKRHILQRVNDQPTLICRLHGKNEEIHFWFHTAVSTRFTILSRIDKPSIIHFNTRTKIPIAVWYTTTNNYLHRIGGPSYISYWPCGRIREQRWTENGDYLYNSEPSRTFHDQHGKMRMVEYRTSKQPLVLIVKNYDKDGKLNEKHRDKYIVQNGLYRFRHK